MNEQPADVAVSAPRRTSSLAVLARGLLGGALGGLIGVFLFRWLAAQGFYGLMIPGTLVGLGAGLAARGKSIPLGISCAIAALALAIYAEWSLFPFRDNKSFGFFLAHVHELRPYTLMMIAAGAFFAYWFGVGR